LLSDFSLESALHLLHHEEDQAEIAAEDLLQHSLVAKEDEDDERVEVVSIRAGHIHDFRVRHVEVLLASLALHLLRPGPRALSRLIQLVRPAVDVKKARIVVKKTCTNVKMFHMFAVKLA